MPFRIVSRVKGDDARNHTDIASAGRALQRAAVSGGH